MTGTEKNLIQARCVWGVDLWVTRKKRRYIVREVCSFDVDDVEYIRITNASNKNKIIIKIQKQKEKTANIENYTTCIENRGNKQTRKQRKA